MAKNISLMGASYPDVPAVDLPQTGGGTARFVDVDIVPTKTSDLQNDSGFITDSSTLNNFWKISTKTVTVGAISAHGYESASSKSVTEQQGYKLVGIVGWASTNYRIRPTTHYVESNTSIYCGFANSSASSVAAGTDVTFRLLWLRSTGTLA